MLLSAPGSGLVHLKWVAYAAPSALWSRSIDGGLFCVAIFFLMFQGNIFKTARVQWTEHISTVSTRS
jgi:hypothetical protein